MRPFCMDVDYVGLGCSQQPREVAKPSSRTERANKVHVVSRRREVIGKRMVVPLADNVCLPSGFLPVRGGRDEHALHATGI